MTTPAYHSVTDELIAEIEEELDLCEVLDCNCAVTPNHLAALLSELSRLRAENAEMARDVEICRGSLEFISRLHIIPPYTSPQAQQLILVKGRADHAMEQTK